MVSSSEGGTLYHKLGGEPGVARVVDDFYGRVTGDERLNRFFVNTDMEKQKQHQTKFLSYALGGGTAYSGRSMQAAHEGLGAGHGDFDAIVDHLRSSLRNAEMSNEDVAKVLELVESHREHIVRQ